MDTATLPAVRPVAVTIIDAGGVRHGAGIEDVRQRKAADTFFWLDICADQASETTALLRLLGLNDGDIEGAQRFGQVARLDVMQTGVRAVTWVAEDLSGLVEIHLRSVDGGILTIRKGNPSTLDTVRRDFSERVAALGEQPFHAVAILLQLLLGTIDNSISEADDRILEIRDTVQNRPESISATELSRRLHTFRTLWTRFDRYASAARFATIGIEAFPVIGEHGIRELNDYQRQVEYVSTRLYQLFREGSDILQDYATILAQRQGDQINKLTVVSIIFLPITFLTGFFGMNFTWMTDRLQNAPVFLVLGILLPVACAAFTVTWLRRKKLL